MKRKKPEECRRPSMARERLKEDQRRRVQSLSPSERLKTALELSDLCRSLHKAVRTTAS